MHPSPPQRAPLFASSVSWRSVARRRVANKSTFSARTRRELCVATGCTLLRGGRLKNFLQGVSSRGEACVLRDAARSAIDELGGHAVGHEVDPAVMACSGVVGSRLRASICGGVLAIAHGFGCELPAPKVGLAGSDRAQMSAMYGLGVCHRPRPKAVAMSAGPRRGLNGALRP